MALRPFVRLAPTGVLCALSASLLSACGGGGSGGGGSSDLPTTASLAFTAPNSTVDLANYTLVSKHDLPQGTGTNLLAAEASAVTYDKDTDTLFVVGDGGTAVVQVSKTGALIDSMQLAQNPSGPQGTQFYDTEGITYVGSGQFVFVEERYRQVDRFTYQAGTTLGAAGVQTVKLGTTIGNIGIEGLSVDPFSGGFVFVKEKDPIGVFQSGVDFALGTATNGSPTTVDSVNLFDPAFLGVIDVADVCSLSTVLSPNAPDYATLLILSQESGRILEVDRSGTILGTLDVGLTTQTEGVTIDQNLVIYVANELGGGPGHSQLWVYAPTTSGNGVGIRSNLYLTFDRTVLAGTGSIVLDDGAGDVRTIAVTDATQVTVSGATVTLNPTNDLLPGRTYSVAAAAGVLKSASGVALPALTALGGTHTFSTRIDALAPTLETSNPADDAAAVTGSHVILTFDEPVKAGSGQIVLHSSALSDDRILQVTDLTQVTITGSTVDITPSLDLRAGTAYYVTVESTAITDLSGNAYAGISTTTALNFQTAGSAPQTPLAIGDLLFVGVNGSGTDAISFVLLKAVNAGTQICFSDKDYAANGTWPTNEAAMTWAADRNYPAGTIVTIQTNTVVADKGLIGGVGGGISTSAETYYAFIGTITNAATGAITVDHFLAALNSGGAAAGTIPAELSAQGTYLTFAADNAKYNASFHESDLAALATRVKDVASWISDNSASGYAIGSNGSMFATPLAPNDLLFMGVNGNGTDAIAFVLLKAVGAGTQICFSDKNYSAAGSPTWPTNEAAFTWTADVAYPAGTIVTIQTNAPVTANKGSAVGTGGGVSTTGETYYAFIGVIADASTGDMVAATFLAAINTAGSAAGDIPSSLTSAGTYFQLAGPNVKYAGSLATGDPAFPSWVKDLVTSWISDPTNGYPLVSGGMFP